MHPFSFHERIISERIIICDRWLQVPLNCPSDSSDLIPCWCLNLWWICEFCSRRLLRTIASVPIRRILSEYYLSSNICQTILTNAPDDCFCYYLNDVFTTSALYDCSWRLLLLRSNDNDVFAASALYDCSWRLLSSEYSWWLLLLLSDEYSWRLLSLLLLLR